MQRIDQTELALNPYARMAFLSREVTRETQEAVGGAEPPKLIFWPPPRDLGGEASKLTVCPRA